MKRWVVKPNGCQCCGEDAMVLRSNPQRPQGSGWGVYCSVCRRTCRLYPGARCRRPDMGRRDG